MKGSFCCSRKGAERKFKRKSKHYLKNDKYKKNTIHPINIHSDEKPLVLNDKKNFKVSQDFVDSLMCELIQCGTCNELFSLGSDKIVGNCGGCNKFLHCGIAGKCIGPNCCINRNDKKHRLTWCNDCVPKKFIINLTNNNINGDCLCFECSTDENVPKIYKSLI